MENVEQRVKKIVAEQLGVNEAEIKNESSFVDDLGADSLDTVELVMALEEEFETEIPDEEAEKITTVQQAIDYIEQSEVRRALAPASCDACRRRRCRVDAGSPMRPRPAGSPHLRPGRHEPRRVVVTGLGIVSPVGIGSPAWDSIRMPAPVSGRSPASTARRFRRGSPAEVKDFDVGKYLSAEGSAALRHVHPLRPRRHDGGGARRRARRLRR